MSDPPVMISETHAVLLVKGMAMATVSLFSAVYAGITAAVGGAEGNTVAIGTTLGVSVTFAGLILRMVVKNQSAIWDIVKSKDKELATKDAEIRQIKLEKEYVEWEREQARYRAKERENPGAFAPSPQLLAIPPKDTTS